MISKRVLFIAVAVLLASTAGAFAAGVNVNNFNVATLDIVGASDYLNLQSTASWGIVGATVTTPVPTPYSTINGYVNAGFNGGGWDGLGGINSSPAAAEVIAGTVYTSLADYLGDDAINFLGVSTFHGHTIAASDTLISYTYYGDSDGDGAVTGADYGYIDFAYSNGGMSGWIWGDYDRDGVVTGADYGYIDYLYSTGGSPLGTLGGGFAAAAAFAPTPVPEPSTIILLAMTGMCAVVAYLRKR